MAFPPGFGEGGSKENNKEKSLLYLYRWIDGWREKGQNSNNGHHLLKHWFVYISQALSVAFTGIPSLLHLTRKETETNTWSHYPGLFLYKGQAFSTRHAVSVSMARLTPGRHYFLGLPYVHPLIPGIQKEISRCSHNLLSASQVL